MEALEHEVDLAREMDLSVPTVTKFIDEMCEEGYINDYGKLETSGGRHPVCVWFECRFGYFCRCWKCVKFSTLT